MSFWRELEESEKKELIDVMKKLQCDLTGSFDLYFKKERLQKRVARYRERCDLIKAYNDLLDETPLDSFIIDNITENNNIGYTFKSNIDAIRRKIHKIEQILLNQCSFCKEEKEWKEWKKQ